jgi:hypothetical protein
MFTQDGYIIEKDEWVATSGSKGALSLLRKLPSLIDDFARRVKRSIFRLCSTQTCQIRREQTRRASIKLGTLLNSVKAP